VGCGLYIDKSVVKMEGTKIKVYAYWGNDLNPELTEYSSLFTKMNYLPRKDDLVYLSKDIRVDYSCLFYKSIITIAGDYNYGISCIIFKPLDNCIEVYVDVTDNIDEEIIEEFTLKAPEAV
jgi:hypothetical protein